MEVGNDLIISQTDRVALISGHDWVGRCDVEVDIKRLRVYIPNSETSYQGNSTLLNKAQFNGSCLQKGEYMRKQDFIRIYKYIGDDDKVYIITKNMSNYKITPIRALIFAEISKLKQEDFIEMNCNVSSKVEVQLSTIPQKHKGNSFMVKEDKLLPLLNTLNISISSLIKDGDVKIKYIEDIYLQESHKYSTIKGKRVSALLNDDKLSYWVRKTQNKLLRKSTNSEHIVLKKLTSAFGKRIKAQQPFTINGKVYFADICIKSKKLIIEVDGGYHNTEEQKQKDAIRDAAFKSIGYTTIRINNEQAKDKSFMSEFIKNIKSCKL